MDFYAVGFWKLSSFYNESVFTFDLPHDSCYSRGLRYLKQFSWVSTKHSRYVNSQIGGWYLTLNFDFCNVRSTLTKSGSQVANSHLLLSPKLFHSSCELSHEHVHLFR